MKTVWWGHDVAATAIPNYGRNERPSVKWLTGSNPSSGVQPLTPGGQTLDMKRASAPKRPRGQAMSHTNPSRVRLDCGGAFDLEFSI